MASLDGVKRFFSRVPRPSDRYAGTGVIVLSGVILAVLVVALFASIYNLWPAVERGKTAADTPLDVTLLFGLFKVKVTLSTGLILLALLAGALGAFIHTATSFVTYVGNRTFKLSWVWWYALRIFMGAALALVPYFVFRGRLIPGQ